VPAWFITELTAKHGDKVVLSSEFGSSVSKNPYLAFKFKGGAKGDKITLSAGRTTRATLVPTKPRLADA
jgi:sulfur-oxidizing protein SoxZ